MIFLNFGMLFPLNSEIFAGFFGSHMLNNGVDKCHANFFTRTLYVLHSFNFSKFAQRHQQLRWCFGPFWRTPNYWSEFFDNVQIASRAVKYRLFATGKRPEWYPCQPRHKTSSNIVKNVKKWHLLFFKKVNFTKSTISPRKCQNSKIRYTRQQVLIVKKWQ